jgi:hypothetical protein
MTDQTLARVGDVIEHGQPIPANVTVLRDADTDRWVRTTQGGWEQLDRGPSTGRGCRWDELTKCERWFPMTVVEVDPEPQPAEPCIAQAHNEDGVPLWQHLCGYVEAFPIGVLEKTYDHAGGGCDECDSGYPQRGDWRPLLSEPSHRPPGPARPRAAESGSVVLSLPQVPDGAVALVGGESGRRYKLFGEHWTGDGPGTDYLYTLSGLLEREGTVTVEFAPPREPRTWPKLDAAPDDLEAVEAGDAGVLRRHPEHRDGWVDKDNVLYYWREVRELGEVREVLT